MRERGFHPSYLAVTIFKWYYPSFESRSIDSVSYGLMAVLTFRAVADATGAAATLATAVAKAVVMADVRAAARASRAADGIIASPPVLSSLSAFPRPPHAILPSMVEFCSKASRRERQLLRAVGLINCCNASPKHGNRDATRMVSGVIGFQKSN